MHIARVEVRRFCSRYLTELWANYGDEGRWSVFNEHVTKQSQRAVQQECTLFLCKAEAVLRDLTLTHHDDWDVLLPRNFCRSRHGCGIGFLNEDRRTPAGDELHRLSLTYPPTRLRYEAISWSDYCIHIEPNLR